MTALRNMPTITKHMNTEELLNQILKDQLAATEQERSLHFELAIKPKLEAKLADQDPKVCVAVVKMIQVRARD